MIRTAVSGTLLMLSFASSAFAVEITCRFDNIPNGSYPDAGPVRNDMFKFALDASGTGTEYGFWTPFFNLGAESEPLTVSSVMSPRCPNCYNIFARTHGEQWSEFKVEVRQDAVSKAVSADVEYRMNVGGPTEWYPFNLEPGVCSIK